MNYIESVRELAMSDEYQNIYVLSKEVATVKIFENCKDFTHIQNIFLRYLNFYYNLYMDIAMDEVSDIVLECYLYSDAYMMWKNKNDKDKLKNLGKEPINTNNKNEKSLNTSTWIFK
jgi:hypothetical protein